MVDYAFCLLPSNAEREKIDNILDGEAVDLQSMNQTAYPPLQDRPVFLNIETKLSHTGGNKSDIQLAIWTMAGLTRTRLLLDERGFNNIEIPALPMLSMHGDDLELSFMKERIESTKLKGRKTSYVCTTKIILVKSL